ncbi:autotransporter domain-containing protein [bacterium BD-1]|nr:autotransporter domain-containing protein [Ottowia caeni]
MDTRRPPHRHTRHANAARRTPLALAIASHWRGAALGRVAFAGLVGLAMLQPMSAHAAEECGAAAPGGSVTCAPGTDPYTGIDYQGVQDFEVVLGSGAQVHGSVAVMGDGEVRFIAESGTEVVGGVAPAIEVASTSGRVTVVADQVQGGLHGIAALSGGGDVSVVADRVAADIAIQAESFAGNVSVVAREVHGGPGGAGVVAGTVTGDIGVSVDEIHVQDALYSQGVFAISDSGAIAVDVGSISITGHRSEGIRALTTSGDIDITAGDVWMDGGEIVGIFAGSDTGDVRIEAGNIGVFGDVARGIFVDTYADIDVRADSVQTNGFIADGVQLISLDGDIRAEVGSIEAGGDWSTGISAETGGSVHFELGTVRTYGEYSAGVGAFAGGDVSIAVDRIEAFGNGSSGVVVGTGEGDQHLVVGSVITHYEGGDLAAAIATSTWSGNTRIDVLDEVVALNGPAILSESIEGGVHVDVRENAFVYGSLAGIMAHSGTGTRVDIAGIVLGGEGPSLQVSGGGSDIRVASTGRLWGPFQLSEGVDVLANDGRIYLEGSSDFGDGADRLVNRGLLALAPLAGPATSVRVEGLERLENAGRISLVNQHTGDLMAFSGELVGGSASRVALDVSLLGGGSADTLEVGTASGRTVIELNLLQSASGLGLDGPVLARATGAASGDEFMLAQTSFGFMDLGLDFDAVDRTWSLESELGERAYRTAFLADGARELWRAGVDAWSNGQRGSREDGVSGWVQVLGGDTDHEGRARSVQGRRDVAWDGSHDGVQVGVEYAAGPWRVGALGGTGRSDMRFGNGDRSEFDGQHLGAYAGWEGANGWYGQALLRADWLDLDTRWASVGIHGGQDARVVGTALEFGRRIAVGSLWLQPSANLQWTDVDLPVLAGTAGSVDLAGGSSLAAGIGLALGNDAARSTLPFQWTVDVTLGRDAGDDGEARLDIVDDTVLVARDGASTQGQLGLGLSKRFGRTELGARVEQAFGDTEGLGGMLSARVRF